MLTLPTAAKLLIENDRENQAAEYGIQPRGGDAFVKGF